MDDKITEISLSEARNLFRSSLLELYTQNEIDVLFKQTLHDFFGFPSTEVALSPQRKIVSDNFQQLKQVLEELKKGKPYQYVQGTAHFMGMEFKVNPHVLIPRPETEELVDWILEQHDAVPQRVCDFCSGSGVIAIALKSKRPKWEVWGVELSPKALEVARENAKRLAQSVSFLEKDILVDEEYPSGIDLLVSNPPYVLPSEKNQMHKNVLENEPEMALFVPENDPLLFYRRLLKIAQRILSKKGHIYFEINALYAAEICALGKAMGFRFFEVKKDLYGRDRFIKFSL